MRSTEYFGHAQYLNLSLQLNISVELVTLLMPGSYMSESSTVADDRAYHYECGQSTERMMGLCRDVRSSST